MNSFTIKDLENLSGIKAHTIRMWEQRYHFLTPKRTESNIRYYDTKELKKLLSVALLNKYGFRISRIHKMTEEEINQKVLELSHIHACEERFVKEMVTAMVDMDVVQFENILDNYILTKGLNKAVQHIVFPFLEKTGILWITGHINPAQESLVTNIIRQKLIVAIESAFSRIEKPVYFLLFLPEGEFHEISLLYVYYLLKSKGFHVLYLGANVSLENAAAVFNQKRVDYIYLHLTTNSYSKEFIEGLHTLFKDTPVVVSGPGAKKLAEKEVPSQFRLKLSFQDTLRFINSL